MVCVRGELCKIDQSAASIGCSSHFDHNVATKVDTYSKKKLGSHWNAVNLLITKLSGTAFYDVLHCVCNLSFNVHIFIPSNTTRIIWLNWYKKFSFINKYCNQIKIALCHPRSNAFFKREEMELFENDVFWFQIAAIRHCYKPLIAAMKIFES